MKPSVRSRHDFESYCKSRRRVRLTMDCANKGKRTSNNADRFYRSHRVPADDRCAEQAGIRIYRGGLVVSTPSPGKGYRLVTDYSETPHPKAKIWNSSFLAWEDRAFPEINYLIGNYYAVPIDPAPVQPIPLAEDPCPWFNEPDRSPAVIIWVIAALLFATGFLIGWSL